PEASEDHWGVAFAPGCVPTLLVAFTFSVHLSPETRWSVGVCRLARALDRNRFLVEQLRGGGELRGGVLLLLHPAASEQDGESEGGDEAVHGGGSKSESRGDDDAVVTPGEEADDVRVRAVAEKANRSIAEGEVGPTVVAAAERLGGGAVHLSGGLVHVRDHVADTARSGGG